MEDWEEYRKGAFRKKNAWQGLKLYVGITTFQVCIKLICSLFLYTKYKMIPPQYVCLGNLMIIQLF